MSARSLLASLMLLFSLSAAAASTSSIEGAMFDGHTRDWLVHLPPGYQPGHPMPLVIVYHGRGDTGAGIEQGIGLDQVADTQGFITVYPDGIYGVWAGEVDSEADAAGVDDVAFTKALLDKLEQEYSIDRQHVVAVGFSNGAHMVHLLGCRLADRISAIVPIGGTLSIESECNPAQPITVLEFHDAKDPVNSYAGGRIGIHHAAWMQPVTKGIGDWAARDKCHTPSTQARYPATGAPAIFYADDFPGCAAGTIVRLYTLYNGTHSWPQTPDVDALIGELAKGQLK